VVYIYTYQVYKAIHTHIEASYRQYTPIYLPHTFTPVQTLNPKP